MRIIHFDWKEGKMKIVPERLEDLWHIERVLENGDIVEGKSFRRFKASGSEGDSGEKKAVRIELEADKIEFHKHANRVRVTGKILSGTPEEFVQIGSFHTLDVELGFPVAIRKKWKQYQIDRLKQAQKETSRPQLSIVVLDETKATFATLRGYGVEFEFEMSVHAGKGDEGREDKQRQFFGDILKKLSDWKGKIIIAGPGFAKDNLKRFIQEKDSSLLKRAIFESCSTAEKSGVNELLKSGVVSKVAQEERIAKEFEFIEKLLAEISKGSGLAAYGLAEVRKANEMKAIDSLFVIDELLRKNKEIEKLVEDAERKAKIHIFSAENDTGKQLEGLGGIAALLRFSMNYQSNQ